MREKTEKERLRLHDEVRAKAGELMRAWKEGRATHKQALKEMSRLRADLAAPVVQEETSVLPQIEHFAPGQQVFHTVFNKRGVVTDVDERRKRVRVDLNGVSLWAAMKDVRQSGLQSIARRLALLYGEESTITVESEYMVYTRVTLRMKRGEH